MSNNRDALLKHTAWVAGISNSYRLVIESHDKACFIVNFLQRVLLNRALHTQSARGLTARPHADLINIAVVVDR